MASTGDPASDNTIPPGNAVQAWRRGVGFSIAGSPSPGQVATRRRRRDDRVDLARPHRHDGVRLPWTWRETNPEAMCGSTPANEHQVGLVGTRLRPARCDAGAGPHVGTGARWPLSGRPT